MFCQCAESGKASRPVAKLQSTAYEMRQHSFYSALNRPSVI
jgi:hypothetical protein